ncbi:hypothetical protein LZ667_22105 [Hafnia alvei]|uniref:hypothetical protein n=1 Tax=Hafnia alvei TaxID=569 RepID=UPI001F1D6E35|nr:hypothetical protein [Hafnia alvei]MCE9874053.1 hypothetical protein [Hafnia alvei]
MALTVIKNNSFKDTLVTLDGIHYEGCSFENCTIQYSGLGEFGLVGCSFNRCKWAFSGPAANTLNFMRHVYKDMGQFGKELVESTFENLKK